MQAMLKSHNSNSQQQPTLPLHSAMSSQTSFKQVQTCVAAPQIVHIYSTGPQPNIKTP